MCALQAAIRWNSKGLVPVIVQCIDTKQVLMHAWMNADTLQETVSTRRMCYWSRSRQARWRKGDSSGHVQHLRSLWLDCDGDTLLALVQQEGVACHTGHPHCFFLEATQDAWRDMRTPDQR